MLLLSILIYSMTFQKYFQIKDYWERNNQKQKKRSEERKPDSNYNNKTIIYCDTPLTN